MFGDLVVYLSGVAESQVIILALYRFVNVSCADGARGAV